MQMDAVNKTTFVVAALSPGDIIVIALSPWGVSSLAASEETTPRRSQPSRLDTQSVGNNFSLD